MKRRFGASILLSCCLFSLLQLIAIDAAKAVYAFSRCDYIRGEDYGRDEIKMIISVIMKKKYRLSIRSADVHFVDEKEIKSFLPEGSIYNSNDLADYYNLLRHDRKQLVAVLFETESRYHLASINEIAYSPDVDQYLVFYNYNLSGHWGFFKMMYPYGLFNTKQIKALVWIEGSTEKDDIL